MAVRSAKQTNKPSIRRPFAHRAARRLPAVIGCDEVGRGALSGPVVVAAVWFDPDCLPRGLLALLDDSKRIARAERELLHGRLSDCVRVRFAARSAIAIDRYGIRTMTLCAMRSAVHALALEAPVRFDGVDCPPGVIGDVKAVVRGDGSVPQIAAASILAKVVRDRLMARLAERHPAYGWHRNCGYGTAHHRAAIVTHGATRHHRRTFGGLLGGSGEGA